MFIASIQASLPVSANTYTLELWTVLLSAAGLIATNLLVIIPYVRSVRRDARQDRLNQRETMRTLAAEAVSKLIASDRVVFDLLTELYSPQMMRARHDTTKLMEDKYYSKLDDPDWTWVADWTYSTAGWNTPRRAERPRENVDHFIEEHCVAYILYFIVKVQYFKENGLLPSNSESATRAKRANLYVDHFGWWFQWYREFLMEFIDELKKRRSKNFDYYIAQIEPEGTRKRKYAVNPASEERFEIEMFEAVQGFFADVDSYLSERSSRWNSKRAAQH